MLLLLQPTIFMLITFFVTSRTHTHTDETHYFDVNELSLTEDEKKRKNLQSKRNYIKWLKSMKTDNQSSPWV